MIVDGKGQIFEDRRKKDDRRNSKSSKAGEDKRKKILKEHFQLQFQHKS